MTDLEMSEEVQKFYTTTSGWVDISVGCDSLVGEWRWLGGSVREPKESGCWWTVQAGLARDWLMLG